MDDSNLEDEAPPGAPRASGGGSSRRGPALALVYTVAALAVAAEAAHGRPPVVTVAFFVGLVVWTKHGAVLLPSNIDVSPSFMVVMAAIAAFDGRPGVVLGAAIVGGSSGLTLDTIREGRWSSLLVNCSKYALSGMAAATAFGWFAGAGGGATSVVRVGVTGLAFGVVNVGLGLPATVVLSGTPAKRVWADMRPALPNYLAFGLLGTFVGELYSALGPIAVLLLLMPVVIARQTFSSYLELQSAREATIRVFVRAIEAKDTYTARHTQRVCRYSLLIGERLGFGHQRLEHLRHSALMHDIGKVAVPKHLLNKPGKLTDDEFERVQRHAHVCIDILGLVDFLQPMTAAAAGHHARYDGGGYGGPEGERPLEAYIVAVADAFDAMTSTRSYRRALPMEVAFEELRNKSGSQFHPDCVDALIAAIEERGERVGLGHEEDVVEFDVAPPVAGVGSAGLGDREHTPTPAEVAS
jgi:hypothetical protein